MNSDIYVHRRKPTVSPPASNGFHECGHTQEERESLKRPPEGGFFTLSVNFKALVCVVENDPEPYTPTCQWCGSKAGIFDIRGLDKQFHAALPGLSDIGGTCKIRLSDEKAGRAGIAIPGAPSSHQTRMDIVLARTVLNRLSRFGVVS